MGSVFPHHKPAEILPSQFFEVTLRFLLGAKSPEADAVEPLGAGLPEEDVNVGMPFAQFIPEPVGPLYAPNLTPGAGGLREWTDVQLVAALRHGLLPDNRAMIGMPAEDTYALNDYDLAALIAYLRQLPPVDNETLTQWVLA